MSSLSSIASASSSPAASPVRTVAIVGAGLIGSSWAAFFLAHGFEVIATDPAPGAEERLRAFVDRAWPALETLGISAGASRERLRFNADLAAAVQGADFIQENGPEVLAAKRALLQAITTAARPEAIIASSTSGFTMSALQEGCTHPERCVIGHPFNPPHLMPLVEVVGGKLTSAAVVDRALAFYTSLGKRAIRLNREVPGHVANRLQAALWREAVHLVAEGVASVADVDAAVTAGPGARWALMGPNLILHLGGGAGGIHHFMNHLSGPFTTWWKDLGNPELTPELRERLIAGVLEEANGRSIAELAAQRDAGLLAVLRCPQREA